MSELSKKHSDRLKELKEKVEEARTYFADNVARYEKFMKFVFKTSMNDRDLAALDATGKPTIEFNILESLISRLRGEFAKQEPNLSVRAADGVSPKAFTPQFSEQMTLIESHFRSIFFDGSNDMLDYNIYSDLLAGGFSVVRVFTEYVNAKSFEQNIYVERVFDPTLTFFDPLARKSSKCDGRFCGELYPMTRQKFEDTFGKEAAENMRFSRNISGFDWSFQNDTEEVVLVCDYYEKKTKREKIVKLSNGFTIVKKEYDKLLEEWNEASYIEQPPVVINERYTVMEYICRYRFCESKVLDYVETDYKYLPLVFFDGNSVVLKEGGSYKQMTRPYVYHAEGVQRLKNFAGQSLANELENLVQHKFVVAVESIPSDYTEAYKNVQKADVLLFNHFMDTNNPAVTLPPPREIQRTQIPPEITNTFRMSDEMTQMILGSYDAAQGVASSQLSGIAFARSAIQSNNSSMPYIVGYIKGLNHLAKIILDLIPKYYRTPRTLPIIKPDGKRGFVQINKQGSLYMNFDPDTIEVKVEAGINFAMQKEIALQTVVSMSQANQGFAKFFNDEGLQVILDNIDIRGIDQLKEKAATWMQKQKQIEQQQSQIAQQQAQITQQQQAMQLAAMQKELQSPTEAQVGMVMVEQQARTEMAKIAVKSQEAETKFIEVLAKIQSASVNDEIKAAKANAEITRGAVETAINMGEKIPSLLGGQNEEQD